MKAKSILLFLAVILLINSGAKAQSQMPTPFYPSDTIWKRTVYRMIDLRFPRNGIMRYFDGAGYKSLMEILLTGLNEYGIDVYEKYVGGEFVNPLTLNKVYSNLGSKIDTIINEDPYTYELDTTITKESIDLKSINLFMIIQEYFFIKSTSHFGSHIIAILPIRTYYKNIEDEETEASEGKGEMNLVEVGWFRFEQIQELLAREKIRDPANENKYSTYLSKFETGNFDSYIVKINNNYGKGIVYYTVLNKAAREEDNGQIVTVKPNFNFMLESHRIEYELFNFRMNLWEY